MNKIVSILLFSIVTSSTVTIFADTTNVAHVTHDHKHKITNPHMAILDAQFASHPIGVLRIRLASHNIRTALAKIDAQQRNIGSQEAEQKLVAEQIRFILGPVAEFFEVITQDSAVLNILRPIVQESLNNPKKSYILDFCNAKKDILMFCDESIYTCEALRDICQEFLQFFGCLNDSLSEKTKKKVAELETEIKRKSAEKKQAATK